MYLKTGQINEIFENFLQTYLQHDQSPHWQRPRLFWWRDPVSCCKYIGEYKNDGTTFTQRDLRGLGIGNETHLPRSAKAFSPQPKHAFVCEDMPATHTRITRIQIAHSPHGPHSPHSSHIPFHTQSDTNVACDVREMQLNHAAKYFWDLRNAYKRNEPRAENWRATNGSRRRRAPCQAADGQQSADHGRTTSCCCCRLSLLL